MKTVLLLLIGIVIGVIGLRAYQDPEFRSQASEFAEGILDWVSETPTPTPTTPAMAALPTLTATPVRVTPIEVSPTLTATAEPSPTGTPEPSQPTATPTLTPIPTPVPASYSIEVVSMEVLDNGQVDFTLEVRNDQVLEGEITQLQMSVDGGAPELVNIISALAPGESQTFAFARALTPGDRKLRFSVGDTHTMASVNVEAVDITATPVPTPVKTGRLVHVITATPITTSAAGPTATVTATMLTLVYPTRTNTATPAPISTNTAVPTNTPIPTITPLPTNTPESTNTPTPIPTPEIALSPDLRHLDEKNYMLDLINAARARSGLDPVILGDNIAAQLHAEAALENCFASHWGIDGLKPYMRYSLAGGYQSNGENGSGSDYCIKASDGYRAIQNINTEIRQAMEGWMGSLGHRRNILGKWHKKVNIGLAWDSYNFLAYQHFEGDYVEYDELPSIENGVLRISGRTKNGARFEQDRDLGIQIFYDPPTHSLTRGQVTRTYCYDGGLQVASLREPLTGGWYWNEDEFTKSYKPCPDPYDVPADASAPRSHEESHRFWKAAYDKSQERQGISIIVPWLTASEWTAKGELLSVKADLSDLIEEYGDGVYTIVVWGNLGAEREVISEYSIFYGVTPPDTYGQ